MKKYQKKSDLTGARYGRLTVVSLHPERQGVARKWLCKCDCGGETSVVTADLNRGQTISCGCYSKEIKVARFKTHGYASHENRSPTWRTWEAMKQRCTKPNATGYENYGGRGITICERWLNSFEAFLEDMGERPEGMTLDRKDNDKGYYKENCRWATPKEQVLNSRSTKPIEYNGVQYESKTALAKAFGMSIQLLNYRLKSGKTLKEALNDS